MTKQTIKQNTIQNIDEHGNVLWLDEERLARKILNYEPYTPPKKGLGIVNFLKEHISARPWNMELIHRIFYLVVGGSRWMKEDSLRNRLYRWVTMISPEKKKHTSAVVLPLDVDLTDAGQKVPVPMDFLKESLKHATYITGMPYCICREAGDCQDYPHDLACLLIGEGARTLVRAGLRADRPGCGARTVRSCSLDRSGAASLGNSQPADGPVHGNLFLLSLLLRRSNPCRQRHPGRKAAVSSGGLDGSG